VRKEENKQADNNDESPPLPSNNEQLLINMQFLEYIINAQGSSALQLRATSYMRIFCKIHSNSKYVTKSTLLTALGVQRLSQGTTRYAVNMTHNIISIGWLDQGGGASFLQLTSQQCEEKISE
jgi:hypothetical protein